MNDDLREEDIAPPVAGHAWVTLMGGLSLCERCGRVWDWEQMAPAVCGKPG